MTRIIATLRYPDAPAAIDWLQETLGFTVHARHDGEDGRVEHAQLVLGGAMVMLGSSREEGGAPSETLYVQLGSDALVDAAHDRAVAAGAEVTMPKQDMAYGGRAFTVRDPQGVSWSYGSYDPFA